ncbi:MAG: hypothetical protein ACREDY_03805 [Bradyrhizobium sp.]
MGRFGSGTAATLAVFFLLTLPVLSARAAALVLAQADKATAPAATAAAAPGATPSPSPPHNAVPGSPISAPAKKSSLSTPACSVRFLEAKVAGKLNGRTWADFRRDECGEKETTAVFPTAISPKYSNEKDIDKARRQTCADQFTANKATHANGGLKWIERDGGYYGECVSRLKS